MDPPPDKEGTYLEGGRWVSWSPSHCPAGHRLGPGKVVIGWYTCHCRGGSGHAVYHCTHGDQDPATWCGQVVLVPSCDNRLDGVLEWDRCRICGARAAGLPDPPDPHR